MKITQLILFFLLIGISKCSKRIYNLTENEFIEVAKGTENTSFKWVMIFYTNNYHDYSKFMDLIKKDIYSFYKMDTNVKFGFLQINKNNAKWLTNLLNIRSIPFLILAYDGRLYNYKEPLFNVENILKFIDEQKSLEDSYPVPDKITIFTKGKILYKMLLNDLNDNFQGILDRLNIKFKWNNILTNIVLVILTIIFFIVEIYLIKSCCMKSIEDDDNFENIKKYQIKRNKNIKKKKNE